MHQNSILYLLALIFSLFFCRCKEQHYSNPPESPPNYQDVLLDSLTAKPYQPSIRESETETLLELSESWADSQLVYQEQLKKYPNNIPLHIQFQDLMYAKQKRPEILPMYRQRAEQKPGDPASLYLYARLLHNKKQGWEIMQKALEIDPQFQWGWIYKGFYLLSFFEEERDSSEIVNCFKTAIQLDNSNYLSFIGLAQVSRTNLSEID